MKRPDFFIIGAPKCGTTALSEYFRLHPKIFMSDPKEPFFFCTDYPDSRRAVHSLDEYHGLFTAAPDSAMAIGEGSTWYLHSEVAIKNIMAYRNDARLIVMLRNPLDMARSLHSQNIVVEDENCLDFETAWNLQASRIDGENIPATCGNLKFLQYGDICMLGHQLERLLSIVPVEQVHIIVFDDFSANTRQVYLESLEFLGVPDDGQTAFSRINANRGYRFPVLRRFMYSNLIYDALRKMKSAAGINKGLGMYTKIEGFNVKYTERKNISSVLKKELKDYFREDIGLLSRLIGRDLSHWVI